MKTIGKCRYCSDSIYDFQVNKHKDYHTGCFDLAMEEGYREMAKENLEFCNMVYGKPNS